MKPVFLALGLLVVWSGAARADFALNPDPNTLWREDGKNLDFRPSAPPSDKYWNGNGDLKGGANGFTLSTGLGTLAGRYVPLSPDYRFFVARISGVTFGNGYRSFMTRLLETGLSPNTVYEAPTGVLVGQLSDPDKKMPAMDYLRLEPNNATVTFTSLEMVRVPQFNLELLSSAFDTKKKLEAGDEATIRVTLLSAAEDVTVTLYDGDSLSPISVGGNSKIQLKPTAKDALIWEAKLPIAARTGGRVAPGAPFPAGGLWMKATILGGPLSEPLWSFNRYPVTFPAP